MKSTVIKYAMGLGVFAIYYLVMRNLENRLAVVRKAANIGAGA